MVSSNNDSHEAVDADSREADDLGKLPGDEPGRKTASAAMQTASPTTPTEHVEFSTERPLFLTATQLRQVESDPYLSVRDVVAVPNGGGGR